MIPAMRPRSRNGRSGGDGERHPLCSGPGSSRVLEPYREINQMLAPAHWQKGKPNMDHISHDEWDVSENAVRKGGWEPFRINISF